MTIDEGRPTGAAGADGEVPGATAAGSGATTAAADRHRLHEMGYAQELDRSMSGFSNFAVSFTIISILSGCLTLYGFGMNTGGPAVIVWGWPFVGMMTLFVGLAMAEVCSSYPTAGGLYYWSAKLAPRNGPAWSWFTGWFNFLGQVAVTAGIDFGTAFFLNALLELQFDFAATPGHTIFLFGLILVAHGLLNTFGVRLVARLNDISVWWHILGVLIIVGALVILPDQHQSADFVFTEFVNNTGWGSTFYVVMLGLLLAQYTFTGYDASAHMTEETHDAHVSGPRGIVMSILVSLAAGWVLLIGVTFAIQSYDGALNSATGVPPAQIFIDAIGETGGKLLLVIVIGAQFFCGMSSVTANSRMIYAFARDGALPASGFWHRLNTRTRTPTNAIWLAAAGAFILGLPYLWNVTAYAAVTSIAVIGLYIAYVMPTLLRLKQGDNFQPGPWNLGRWSRIIGTIAVAWVAFITVLFMLPQVNPITRNTFNYTPVAVLVVLGFAGIWWLVSARHWFTGPKVQGTPEELAAIEADLESV
jgi:amino acid permease (GABA permease)